MYDLKQLVETVQDQAEIDGKWVPARPENYKFDSYWERIKDAWAVFTRKADAFKWPGEQ